MEQVGIVYVDAGLVWVGDPCYVLGKDASHGVSTWSEFCDKLFAQPDYDTSDVHEVLGTGIGLAIDTTWGDGAYPVYADKNRQGRVTSIHVYFDDDPNAPEDEWESENWEEDDEGDSAS